MGINMWPADANLLLAFSLCENSCVINSNISFYVLIAQINLSNIDQMKSVILYSCDSSAVINRHSFT